jgi:hypothetical protein
VEAGLEIGLQGGRVVERAGVDVDPAHVGPPGEVQGPGEQPRAVALAGELGDEAEEADQAFARGAEVELEQADLGAGLV